ncbi:MAG: hypothetical protein KDN19_16175 [Verrucomicrobiae bacterium]|nr:hypothetical protein [Verrucomicrobiae bacterium]
MVKLLAWLSVAAVIALPTAHGELVERELGTDAEGNVVTGYVFQGGREFRGSARRSSGLSPRRVERPSRSRGRIDHGYSYGYSPYWVVPVIPLHCGGGISLWRGTGTSFTVTVVR